MESSISRATKIALNQEFHPSSMYAGFKKWTDKGLVYIGQLFQGQTLKSFQQLSEEFNLPAHDHYKFLQMRNYLQKNKEWGNLSRDPSNTEQLFVRGEEEKIKKGVISQFFRALQEDLRNKDWESKLRWERELNDVISEIEWEEACLAGHKLTNSPNWREFDWKVKNRYFRTPVIMAKFGNSSGLCWRGCGQQGDLSHILWACPKLQGYWEDVKKEIERILDIKLIQEPKLFILGIPIENQMAKNNLYLLRTMLLIAKKTITILWLQPQPPNIQQWQNKVNEVFIMEKITAKIQLKMDNFSVTWSPWITNYIRNEE